MDDGADDESSWQDEVQYEGYLEKRGVVISAFRRRYFCLRPNVDSPHTWELAYYDTKESKKMKGSINLSGSALRRHSSNPKEFSISLSTDVKREYVIRGSQQPTVEEWCRRIQLAIEDSMPDDETSRLSGKDLTGDDHLIDEEDDAYLGSQELKNTSFRPHQFCFGDRVILSAQESFVFGNSLSKRGALHCISFTKIGRCGFVHIDSLNDHEVRSYCEFQLLAQTDKSPEGQDVGHSWTEFSSREVNYGVPLLLRHVMSGAYLCSRDVDSEKTEKDNKNEDSDSFQYESAELQKGNHRLHLIFPNSENGNLDYGLVSSW